MFLCALFKVLITYNQIVDDKIDTDLNEYSSQIVADLPWI